MTHRRAAWDRLRKRLLQLVQGRRHGEPEEQRECPDPEDEEQEDGQRLGALRRWSHSTPGLIAAANVKARSSRTMMLRTFQRPKAIAATPIAPAAARAAATRTSGRPGGASAP